MCETVVLERYICKPAIRGYSIYSFMVADLYTFFVTTSSFLERLSFTYDKPRINAGSLCFGMRPVNFKIVGSVDVHKQLFHESY